MNLPRPDKGTQIFMLGGVGEFGVNATLVRTAQATVLIDFGLMFPPDGRQPGVDYYIHDIDHLLATFPDLSAAFFTHGHEDHIGGAAHLAKAVDLDFFATPYTARLLDSKCAYFGLEPKVRVVTPGEQVAYRDLKFEWIEVTHSIIEPCALAVTTPDGVFIHSGDFKVDPLPAQGHRFHAARFADLGEAGVDLLMMDSTNASKPGFAPSDSALCDNWEQAIQSIKGAVFFTTFSSHMPRLFHIAALAKRSNRRIIILGSNFKKHFRLGGETGFFEMDRMANLFITKEQAQKLPPERLMYVATGSQAEPRSALMRVLRGQFPGVSLSAGDGVIFASRPIPGNERACALMVSDLEQKGVEAITHKQLPIHTSGHGYQEDLAYMLALTKPGTVVPIHGEFTNLLRHFNWLRQVAADPADVLFAEDGDCLLLLEKQITKSERISNPLVPIDGNRECILTREVLRDRKTMMYCGMLLIAANRGSEGDLTFQLVAHGLAEERPNFVNELREYLEKETASLVDLPEQWADSVLSLVRRFCRHQRYGVPLLKLTLDGNILR